jgi:hypothetical protein
MIPYRRASLADAFWVECLVMVEMNLTRLACALPAAAARNCMAVLERVPSSLDALLELHSAAGFLNICALHDSFSLPICFRQLFSAFTYACGFARRSPSHLQRNFSPGGWLSSKGLRRENERSVWLCLRLRPGRC